jgi:predicted Zn-dependent protease
VRRKFKRLLAASLSFCLFAEPIACLAAASETPPVGYSPLANSDEGGLWMMVGELEKGTQQSPQLIKDEALNNYLHNIVCRLAGPQCASIRLYLVDVPQFNASCYPNGMLHVWTGLLLRTENEAQLAFVLGHELTHYFNRHGLNAYQAHRDTLNGLAFLSIGVAAVGVRTNTNLSSAMDLARLVAVGALFSYSRDQEREADAGGFRLAVAQGYDPRQGARIWQQVEDEQEANPRRSASAVFFSDHPTNKSRLTDMNKLASQEAIGLNSGSVSESEFKKAMAPFRSQWLAEELDRGQLDESIALIRRLLASEPTSGELQFYLGEAYRRRNDKGDLDIAVSVYEDAIANQAPNSAYRGLGIAALKSGKREIAIDSFKKYLSLMPTADDRSMVEFYLNSAGGAL